MKLLPLVVAACIGGSTAAEAGVTRLHVDRREVVLNGRPFGAAGPYEKLSGTVHFALDPALPQNRIIVDLNLAPANAKGLVEFSADFYLLKPVDPRRGNGRLFYEAGNRGTKRILPVFQEAANSADPSTAAEFGNGALMRQGFTLLWMGWQWDVPEGRMRMEIPIATENGRTITGWVRGNFIPGANATSALIADRGHQPYPVVDPESAEHRLLVRTVPTDTPREIARHVAIQRPRIDHARSRLRTRTHLRRRLSRPRSARRGRGPRRYSRPRQLLQTCQRRRRQSHALRLRSGQAWHYDGDRLGRVADRTVPAPLRLPGFQ
jgi:hypothetical protein